MKSQNCFQNYCTLLGSGSYLLEAEIIMLSSSGSNKITLLKCEWMGKISFTKKQGFIKAHLSSTRHWALPNSREALSHQLKKRELQDVWDISKTERVSYHDLMDRWIWIVIDNGPKIQWVMFVRFSLFHNPVVMPCKVNIYFWPLTNM